MSGVDIPPPAALDPAMRAFLVEMQRGLIAQANAARRLLGLPPVVAPDARERAKARE